ncbi:MAG: hypothetical protein A2Z98_13600, partial [Spirochaetes bacterium GWB1_27_13]
MNISNISTIAVIFPIFIFSIISMAIIIEKFGFFSKNKINLSEYQSYFPNSLTALKEKCLQTKNHIFNNTLVKLLSEHFNTKQELQEYIDSLITTIYIEYKHRLNYLSIFSKLSTLIGFFGTIIGMILSFNSIVEKGVSTASIVAGGISTALITTAVGLSVAI